MIPSAYDLRDFYKTLGGRIVRRLLKEKIATFWSEESLSGLRFMGCGYSAPYIKMSAAHYERAVCLMFTPQGVHHWPEDGSNLACLCDETDLPFETNSVDRILIIHSLEFSGFLKPAYEEFWRVLKSSGRILIIVPNRHGLWSRAEWTPFGRGTPYSAGQVETFLRENLFIPERTERALFFPPFKSQTMLRFAGGWEKLGRKLWPALGGVILVEASKQIYAGTGKAAKETAKIPVPSYGTAKAGTSTRVQG